MKLVKLNRRHKAHKEKGHNWAFRWASYDETCGRVERIMQKMHGSQYQYMCNDGTCCWSAGFGSPARGNCYRTYWISFVNEHDATMVLLRLEQDV